MTSKLNSLSLALILYIGILLCLCSSRIVHASIEFRNQDHSNYGGDDEDTKAHIREHLQVLMEKAEELGTLPPELGEEDMIYYLFLIHDLNGDGFLDGHELREAFTDFVGHGENNKNDDNVASSFQIPLEEVTEMVDHVLLEDDMDGDGLISWSEYLESQSYHGQ